MRPVLVFISEEQNHPDTHRLDGEEWSGPRITVLSQILAMLPEEPWQAPEPEAAVAAD